MEHRYKEFPSKVINKIPQQPITRVFNVTNMDSTIEIDREVEKEIRDNEQKIIDSKFSDCKRYNNYSYVKLKYFLEKIGKLEGCQNKKDAVEILLTFIRTETSNVETTERVEEYVLQNDSGFTMF